MIIEFASIKTGNLHPVRAAIAYDTEANVIIERIVCIVPVEASHVDSLDVAKEYARKNWKWQGWEYKEYTDEEIRRFIPD